MGNKSLYEKNKIQEERSMSVYKRDDMIQKGRFKLSVQEQRAVLYAISKIKPTDSYMTEYVFDIKDFYRVIGWEKQSYTEFRTLLKALRDRSWWVELENGDESAVSWFSTVRPNKRSGKVKIKFHEDMMPYLLQVAEQGEFYTFFNLKYVLPMSSKHSPRLYEILKSYNKNNRRWFFELDTLKHLMNCEKYHRWPDFRRYVLDVAVDEINKYTDLAIKYYTQGEGRRVEKVVFLMDDRTSAEKYVRDQEIEIALDGQLNMFEMDDEKKANAEWLLERRKARHGE